MSAADMGFGVRSFRIPRRIAPADGGIQHIAPASLVLVHALDALVGDGSVGDFRSDQQLLLRRKSSHGLTAFATITQVVEIWSA